MERFAAMVAGRRATSAPTAAPAEEEEVKEKGKKKGKEEDEPYLSIQLEEIIVVKNEDIIASSRAANGINTLGGSACNHASPSPSMEQCAKAAGSSTAAAARGAWTTVARIGGFD